MRFKKTVGNLSAVFVILGLGFLPNFAHAITPSKQLVDQGIGKYKSGNLNGAIQDFTKAIQLDPRCSLAGEGVLGVNSQGITLNLDNLDNNPSCWAFLYRGNVKAETGDTQGAILDYDSVIQLNPRFAEAYFNRGIVKYRSGDFQDSIVDIQRAEELYRRSGDLQEANKARDVLNKFKAKSVSKTSLIAQVSLNQQICSEIGSKRDVFKFETKKRYVSLCENEGKLYLAWFYKSDPRGKILSLQAVEIRQTSRFANDYGYGKVYYVRRFGLGGDYIVLDRQKETESRSRFVLIEFEPKTEKFITEENSLR